MNNVGTVKILGILGDELNAFYTEMAMSLQGPGEECGLNVECHPQAHMTNTWSSVGGAVLGGFGNFGGGEGLLGRSRSLGACL